jgi:hypothetical protein
VFYAMTAYLGAGLQERERTQDIDMHDVFASYKGILFAGEPVGPKMRRTFERWGLAGKIFNQTSFGDSIFQWLYVHYFNPVSYAADILREPTCNNRCREPRKQWRRAYRTTTGRFIKRSYSGHWRRHCNGNYLFLDYSGNRLADNSETKCAQFYQRTRKQHYVTESWNNRDWQPTSSLRSRYQ